MKLLCTLLILVLTVGMARAEDIVTYEVDGEANAAATDPRVAALDDAFSRAITTAVADLVSGNLRTTRKQDLDREIIGRARLWIAKFTVTKDQTADDRRQLTVTVRVDRDKMRARLAELGITQEAAVVEAPRAGRGVAILLRLAEPSGLRATYGLTADRDVPGSAIVATALKNAGYAIRRAPSSGPAARATGELDDDEAAALAAEAKAEFVAVVGVLVGAATPVRGVATQAVLVTTNIKLLEIKGGKLVGQGAASVAAPGEDAPLVTQAIERALRGALADVLPAQPHAIAQAPSFHGDDTPVSEPGVVLVRLAPKTPWSLVLAEQKFLLGAKGVQRAALRRLSPGGWIIGVTTDRSVEQVASIARRPPAKDTSANVKVVGGIVEVALLGSP